MPTKGNRQRGTTIQTCAISIRQTSTDVDHLQYYIPEFTEPQPFIS